MLWRALLLILWGSGLWAGPWLREPGTGFLSFGASVPQMQTPTIYAEYGLNDRLTIGLDSVVGNWRPRRGQDLAFARFSVLNTGPWRGAAELGLGVAYRGPSIQPVGRVGLSFGRGLPRGWAALDLHLSAERRPSNWSAKAEATLGHNLTDRLTLLGQVRHDWRPGVQNTGGTAGVVLSVTQHIRVLASIDHQTGGRAPQLRLATWITFWPRQIAVTLGRYPVENASRGPI